ncbi:hypothetical protein [Streptomyces sp. RPT161]|uniref:hypothetical protein n=1 Tax=Streptomyces sp. RPT161 TaxID=3015993 RepID=UPI0022B8B7E2|nr:hypothetical protein [Streptomyces sp. RPT161]
MAGPVPFRKKGKVGAPAADDGERGSADQRRATRPDRAAVGVRRGVSLVRRVGSGARAGATVLTERLVDAAPRIPVRDLATLRAQFPGLGPEEIADRLVAGATAGTATVGAGIGAAAMLPVPPAMTAELAAETLAVAAVEFKLIAELHEVYGVPATGTVRQRAAAYLGAWTEQRGIQVSKPSSVDVALSAQMKRELRQQLVKRTARHLPTLTPLMVGAAVGAVLNRRDTRKLAQRVRADLRQRQMPWEDLDAPSAP